jgi:crotonobetainyl-CoA:carnitine CoA-transferase CaiB-like acyl-CoA transferase
MASLDARPLDGIFVLDLVNGPMAAVGRTLAELGAEVFHITAVSDEVEETDREAQVIEHTRHVGKNLVRLNPLSAEGVLQLSKYLERADVILTSPSTGFEDLAGARTISRDFPAKVVMTISDFGRGTSFSSWIGTDPVFYALSGELARSGLEGRAPLLPPASLATAASSSQATYNVVVALYRALTTGSGCLLDFSTLDGVCQTLDPGYGIGGSAAQGARASDLPRSRPPKGRFYPVLPCADGKVRLCVLSSRQWHGMFKWMGSPAQFADPKFEKLNERFDSPDLTPAIERFFSAQTREELEAGGRDHGVPITAVRYLSEFIKSDHVISREAIVELAMPGSQPIQVPNGVLVIDGQRMGPGISTESSVGKSIPRALATRETDALPFAGLKVLDLGVIVAGAEAGRLLGDLGADVVKIESSAFPDGSRQALNEELMSASFAAGHRNKRSLALDLKSPEGKALFLRLAQQADVILSNFKPGTLVSLGLDYSTVVQHNPAIIMVDSSAFGPTGPWSRRMGYGPLVRASAGLTELWSYPDESDGFSDSVTIYPDHTAARYSAIGVTSLLIRRLRTKLGGTASVAQTEVMLSQMAAEVALLSASNEGKTIDTPWGVYPCKGDDEWCAVTVENSKQWFSLATAIGFSPASARDLNFKQHRAENRSAIESKLLSWLASRTPLEAMTALQEVGVPAGAMLRVSDMPDFAYFKERNFFRKESHPSLDECFLTERASMQCEEISDPAEVPAPLMGENTREVLSDWLSISLCEIDRLVADAIVEVR